MYGDLSLVKYRPGSLATDRLINPMAAVNLAADQIKSSFDELQRASASAHLLRHVDESRVEIDIPARVTGRPEFEKARRFSAAIALADHLSDSCRLNSLNSRFKRFEHAALLRDTSVSECDT